MNGGENGWRWSRQFTVNICFCISTWNLFAEKIAFFFFLKEDFLLYFTLFLFHCTRPQCNHSLFTIFFYLFIAERLKCNGRRAVWIVETNEYIKLSSEINFKKALSIYIQCILLSQWNGKIDRRMKQLRKYLQCIQIVIKYILFYRKTL